MSTIIWGRVPQSRDALATGVGRPCPCPGPYLGRLCCLFKGMCLRRPQPHRLFAPPSHGRSARHTERGPEGSEGPATLSLSISRLKSAGTLVLGTLVLAFKVPPSLRRFQLSIYLLPRFPRFFLWGSTLCPPSTPPPPRPAPVLPLSSLSPPAVSLAPPPVGSGTRSGHQLGPSKHGTSLLPPPSLLLKPVCCRTFCPLCAHTTPPLSADCFGDPAPSFPSPTQQCFIAFPLFVPSFRLIREPHAPIPEFCSYHWHRYFQCHQAGLKLSLVSAPLCFALPRNC